MKIPNREERISQMIDWSREIHRHNHDEKKEYEIAQKAINEALELNNDALYARALDNQGLLYRYHNWYSQAVPLHIKAYRLVASQKDVPAIQKMIFANNAGVAARYDEQYDLAIEYYLYALRLAQKENNIKNIAIASNGLGNSLVNFPQRAEEALAYFQQALKAERMVNDSLGIAMDLLSIGDYYIEQKMFSKAKETLNELYEINNARKDLFGLAITNQFLGKAYFKEARDLGKAKNYYQTALDQFRQLKNEAKQAELLQHLGSFYLQFGQLAAAERHFLQSIQLSEKINNKSLISENAYSLSELKKDQKQYAAALQYFQQGKAYEDSIALSQQQVKIAALTNRYRMEQKENEIADLEQQNRAKEDLVSKQEQKIKTHRLYFMVAFLGLALILAFVYFQRRSNQAKNKALKLLHHNQEELLKTRYEKSIVQAEMLAARTQLNPHFLFNCLTGIHLFLQKNETQKADQYLIVLSRYLRMVLELPKNDVVSLRKEVDLIKQYITLEEKRFNNDFCFRLTEIPEDQMSLIDIPPLLLQPYVENAIIHGLLPSPEAEKILTLEIKNEGEDIQIIIEDNGVGRSNTTPTPRYKSKSLGMKITADRIKHFNSTNDSKIEISIVDKVEETTRRKTGTKVVLTLKNCLKLQKVENL